MHCHTSKDTFGGPCPLVILHLFRNYALLPWRQIFHREYRFHCANVHYLAINILLLRCDGVSASQKLQRVASANLTGFRSRHSPRTVHSHGRALGEIHSVCHLFFFIFYSTIFCAYFLVILLQTVLLPSTNCSCLCWGRNDAPVPKFSVETFGLLLANFKVQGNFQILFSGNCSPLQWFKKDMQTKKNLWYKTLALVPVFHFVFACIINGGFVIKLAIVVGACICLKYNQVICMYME